MRYGLITAILSFSLLFNSSISVAQDAAAQDGATTFKTICAACHTIGKGRLVGPDLAGVTDIRSEDWLIRFIKSSQTVIKSGDKVADSLFKAFNNTIMPDQPTFDDAKIKGVLAYIKAGGATASSKSGGESGASTTVTVQAKEPFLTKGNIWMMVGMVILLIVIFSLARINKNLADEIKDVYSSDRSFFKKSK